MGEDDQLLRISTAPREHAMLVRGPSDPLVILVDRLDPVFRRRGMYGPEGTDMPDRFQWLAPEAAASLLKLEQAYPGCFYYSDVFRNARGSANRRKKNRKKRMKRGLSPIYTGKKPGSSAHSFGYCTDDMVEVNIQRLRRRLDDPGFNKSDYDALKREFGWVCHRDGPNGGDHRMEHEFWHFNYLGDDLSRWMSHSNRKTSGGVEAKVLYNYGPFTLDPDGIREHLDRIGYFPNHEGITRFQKDWTLTADGIAGPETQRTLLYVGATFRDSNNDDHDLNLLG